MRKLSFYVILIFSLLDYSTDVSVSTGKAYWLAPWDCSIQSAIGALLVTAPTGSSAIFDLNLEGTTMMTTNKIEIDATEKSSITATTQPAFTTQQVEKGNILSCDIDQIGSSVAGVGPSITLIVTRS